LRRERVIVFIEDEWMYAFKYCDKAWWSGDELRDFLWYNQDGLSDFYEGEEKKDSQYQSSVTEKDWFSNHSKF
jgi:hypothetical protein